jgi:hypothetical protein
MYHADNTLGIVSPADLNLGYSAFVRLRFSRNTSTDNRTGKPSNGWRQFVIYAHHGAGGGRKKGAKVNRMTDHTTTFPLCDMYLMGHVHDRIAWVDPLLDISPRSDKIIERWRAFGITGTFKRTYQQGGMGYGEKQMYPATALGVISFTVLPFPHDDGPMQITAHNSTTGLPA